MASRGPESRPGEFELIAKLFAPLAKNVPGAFGLRDDVATLAPPKAGYLLTLLLPDWTDTRWLERFTQGLSRDQSEFGVALIGGDMSGMSGPLAISVTAYGFAPAGAMIRRAGARPGDTVFVSGTIGDAGGGLAVLKGEAPAEKHSFLVTRYRTPLPRVALGQALRGVASAALDVSDGLMADLEHLADVSQVAISVDAARVPLSAELLALRGDTLETRQRACIAGDDYEIAFTSSARESVADAARHAGVTVTEIGRVEAGRGVRLLDGSGREIALPRKGFAHF